MDLDLSSYLGSRPVWYAAILYILVGNILVFGVDRVFGAGISVALSAIISPLFLAVAIYYLKSFDIGLESAEDLIIGTTFAAVSAVSAVFTLLGYLIFVPSMFFMGLSSLMWVPSSFLSSIGVYYLFEDYKFREVKYSIVSVLTAGLLTFSVYVFVSGRVATLNLFLNFITRAAFASGLAQGFLMLSAMVLGLYKYIGYDKRVLAALGLSAFGSLSAALNYVGGYLSYLLNPEFPRSVLISPSWEPVIVISTGLVYYAICYLKEIYDY